jgi:hypothetical protein
MKVGQKYVGMALSEGIFCFTGHQRATETSQNFSGPFLKSRAARCLSRHEIQGRSRRLARFVSQDKSALFMRYFFFHPALLASTISHVNEDMVVIPWIQTNFHQWGAAQFPFTIAFRCVNPKMVVGITLDTSLRPSCKMPSEPKRTIVA